jgi:hypothetical protein
VTAKEIRAANNEHLANFLRLAKRDKTLELSPIVVAVHSALMEIAAQLAEMNERNRRLDSKDVGLVGLRDFTPGGKPLE